VETRHYFYSITTKGELIHDGAILDDERFLDFFTQRIEPNETGLYSDYKYVSKCGPEWNYIACADTPIVFQHLIENRLYYAPNLSVEFNPNDLRFGNQSGLYDGVLYHRSPIGKWGRITPNVLMELSPKLHSFGSWFCFDDGQSYTGVVVPPIQVPEGIRLLRPRAENQCIACGEANPYSFRLSFIYDENKKSAETWFIPDIRMMGSLGIMHGGFVSLLLDEVMGKVLTGLGIKAPTVQLNVRFKKPVKIGSRLHLYAEMKNIDGRKHSLYGAISHTHPTDNTQEETCAEAEGLFLSMRD
jgi:acyl-coenzyme A thioesterase PaaI-like protein